MRNLEEYGFVAAIAYVAGLIGSGPYAGLLMAGMAVAIMALLDLLLRFSA